MQLVSNQQYSYNGQTCRYQHAYLDYCSVSSLRQHSTGRHVDTNILTWIIVVLAHCTRGLLSQ
jgi:hypothetical protein